MATQSTEDHGEARDEDQTTMVEEDRDRKDSDIVTDLSLSSSSFDDESAASDGSSCSSEACDDASSSSSSSKSNGTVYDLSELIAQLPIKRGLSKYYNGKSESFTSLARVTSIEDLEKKAPIPYKRKLKASKSYGGCLHHHHHHDCHHHRSSSSTYTLPKRTISKKGSKGSLSLSCLAGTSKNFIGSHRPSPVKPPV